MSAAVAQAIEQMSAEIARLREELAQARERIAVLESRTGPLQVFGRPLSPTNQPPGYVYPTVIATAQATSQEQPHAR